MSASPFPELSSKPVRSVAAIVYTNEAYPDAFFRALICRWRALVLSVAGVQQHQVLTECEGGGLRDLIASSIDRGIPVVIGVSGHRFDAWRKFTGDFAVELSADASEVERWLEGLR